MENTKGVITLKREDFLIPLDIVLTECSNAVHVGLSYLDKFESFPEELDAADSFMYFQPYGGNMSPDDRKKMFKSWLLQKSFEDLIKAVTLMLIDINKILNLQAKFKQTQTGNEFINTINTPDYEPSTKHFPQLLDAIRPYLVDDLSFEKEINSINRVRRCLVHRNGYVSPIDCFKGDSVLKLNWIFLRLVYIKDGKEIDFKPPVTILEGGGEIQGKREQKIKEYQVNEKIEFDFQHFNELILTCRFFAQDVIEKIRLEKQN